MEKIPRASGFLILCQAPTRKFLLMQHRDRWDLPKGHVDPGESDLDAAYRELEEETGILKSEVEVDPSFRFEHRYEVSTSRYRLDRPGTVTKTLVIFLGLIPNEREIQLTEHIGFRWFAWEPPHRIQTQTIDPLLSELESHLI